MCMHNVLGNRAIEGKLKSNRKKFIVSFFFCVVLANHLQLAVEQNQTWQVDSIDDFIPMLNFRL